MVSQPAIRGSDDPDAPDFNSDWIYFNPENLIDPEITGSPNVCPTLFIHGTQDPLVPLGWDIRLQESLHSRNQVGITAFYPLGSHATDVVHWTPYGQSVIYYLERFLAVTRAY